MPPRPTEDLTSRSLLQRARDNSQAAWRQLVELYRPLVLLWCSRARLQGPDAEDVSQEVFAAVAARLIDAYEDGLLERSEFEPRLRRAKGRLEKLEAEAAALAAAAAEEHQLEAVLGQLQELTQRVSEGLQEASWATQREVIRALVKRVEVDTSEVRVIYKVPPHPFVVAAAARGSRSQSWRPIPSPCCPRWR
jgi:hypothetical protein